MSLVAPRHVGSSWTRDQTRVSCIGRQTLHLWATREALDNLLKYPKVFLIVWNDQILFLGHFSCPNWMRLCYTILQDMHACNYPAWPAVWAEGEGHTCLSHSKNGTEGCSLGLHGRAVDHVWKSSKLTFKNWTGNSPQLNPKACEINFPIQMSGKWHFQMVSLSSDEWWKPHVFRGSKWYCDGIVKCLS